MTGLAAEKDRADGERADGPGGGDKDVTQRGQGAGVEQGVEEVHELGEGVKGNDFAGGGLENVDVIADGGEPEAEHQGDLDHVLEVAEFDLQHREGQHDTPDEGDIQAERQRVEQQPPVINTPQKRIEHHQDQDGDEPQRQRK